MDLSFCIVKLCSKHIKTTCTALYLTFSDFSIFSLFVVTGCNVGLCFSCVQLQFGGGWACEKNTSEGTQLYHQGALAYNNLPSFYQPHIPNIRTVSMLWMWMVRGDKVADISQLDVTMSISTKTQFAHNNHSCMLSVKSKLTQWSSGQTSISYNPALCCTFYS